MWSRIDLTAVRYFLYRGDSSARDLSMSVRVGEWPLGLVLAYPFDVSSHLDPLFYYTLHWDGPGPLRPLPPSRTFNGRTTSCRNVHDQMVQPRNYGPGRRHTRHREQRPAAPVGYL